MNLCIRSLVVAALFLTTSLQAEILILRGSNQDFIDFSSFYAKEIPTDLGPVTEREIDSNTVKENLYRNIQAAKPRLIVALDNRSVNLIKQLIDDNKILPPVLASMALNLKHALSDYQDYIAGLGYEVSGYSIVSELNKIVDQKFRKIKVLYRKSLFHDQIVDAYRQLKRENVEIVAINVEDDDQSKMNKKISRALEADKGEDAVWLILDNKIINKSNFSSIWLKYARSEKKPVICGVQKFAQPPINLCTFAAYPNIGDLARHLAEMSMGVLEDELTPDEIGVEYSVSSKKVIRTKQLNSVERKVVNKRIDFLEVID